MDEEQPRLKKARMIQSQFWGVLIVSLAGGAFLVCWPPSPYNKSIYGLLFGLAMIIGWLIVLINIGRINNAKTMQELEKLEESFKDD